MNKNTGMHIRENKGCKDKIKEPTALISNLQHFSTGDGPGIRSTIFFQGCNLNCIWCHNPESIPLQAVLMFYAQRCTDCGQCTESCQYGAHKMKNSRHVFVRDACTNCGHCVDHCPSDVLCLSGLEMTIREVLDFIVEDIEFYQASGGGVTLSGGEPLLQADFCAQIAMNCKKKGLSVIVDTAGNVDYSEFKKTLPYVDHFYFDLKGATQDDYVEKAGGSLTLVLENMTHLIVDGAKVTARIPIIPGYNDDPEYMLRLRDILKQSGVNKIHLLPFHRLGSSKYKALGKSDRMREVIPSPKEKLRALLNVFTPEFLASIEW